MKTSTLPPLRVSPELRADAEGVLAPGESLSSFVHDAVTRTIEYRKAQQESLERGHAGGSIQASNPQDAYGTPDPQARASPLVRRRSGSGYETHLHANFGN